MQYLANRQSGGRGKACYLHIIATFLAVVLGAVLLSQPAQAQNGLGVQARILAEGSQITRDDQHWRLELALSQAVPFRFRLLTLPPRAVLDVNTLDWSDAADLLDLTDIRKGGLPDGWARLVIDLGGPFVPQSVSQQVDAETGQARLSIYLHKTERDSFEARAMSETGFVARFPDRFLHPDAAAHGASSASDRVRPVVMLDPGHGGIDPGAERDGIRESDLVLAFARKLREELQRRDSVDVAMTRDADIFVSLDGRIRAARAAGADLFISLHADALPEGLASGSVIYLLGDKASDDSAAYLAERHDRADLLAGVDLARNTDDIARVLMSVAWQDTAPRSKSLAEAFVDSIGSHGLRLHRRPVQAGAFSVLRAPDMPSVLIELGFMSSPRDLANLQDPDWTARMVTAMADGIESWLELDQAQSGLRRR
ncbi:MAG: N-acetylmuramoyl-L-alanine amidase [Rhodobacteraceae bacterium]|nr:N-acetylmuramoyl-L-alanine amidase [Paracoccaceae bacterium]